MQKLISKDISDMLDLKLQDSDMEHLVMANNSKLKIVGETDTHQNRTFELNFLIVERRDIFTIGDQFIAENICSFRFDPELTVTFQERFEPKLDEESMEEEFTDEELQEQAHLILMQHPSLTRDIEEFGKANVKPIEIELTDENPVVVPEVHLKRNGEEMRREMMAKLLRQNAIKRSTSDYATNAFFIGKKSSSQKRPVIDYRGMIVKVKSSTVPIAQN